MCFNDSEVGSGAPDVRTVFEQSPVLYRSVHVYRCRCAGCNAEIKANA